VIGRRSAEASGAIAGDAGDCGVIAYHFTQAHLDDLAIEWWSQAGDQALRRSAFQEAIYHLGKAIAMADKPGGGAQDVAIGTRLKLQTAYGQAMMWAKGFAAEENKSRLRARCRACGKERQLLRALCGGSRSMDHRARARRTAVGERTGVDVPAGG